MDQPLDEVGELSVLLDVISVSWFRRYLGSA
jgi:hypothetical protein